MLEELIDFIIIVFSSSHVKKYRGVHVQCYSLASQTFYLTMGIFVLLPVEGRGGGGHLTLLWKATYMFSLVELLFCLIKYFTRFLVAVTIISFVPSVRLASMTYICLLHTLRLLLLAGTNFSILVVCSNWQVLILVFFK